MTDIASFLSYCQPPNYPSLDLRQERTEVQRRSAGQALQDGRAARASGNYEAAMRILRSGLCSGPYSFALYTELALTYTAMGQDSEAVVAYELALSAFHRQHGRNPSRLELRRESAKAEANFGSSLAHAGRCDEAVVHLAAAIRTDPTVHSYWTNRAAVKAELGRLELGRGNTSSGRSLVLQSLADADQAIRLNSSDPLAYYNRAQALRMLGRDAESAQAMEAARGRGLESAPNLVVRCEAPTSHPPAGVPTRIGVRPQ